MRALVLGGPGVVLVGFVTLAALFIVGARLPGPLELDGRDSLGLERPTLNTVLSGAWMDTTETWASDHFPGRGQWLEAHALIETRVLRDRVVNGALVDVPTGNLFRHFPDDVTNPDLAMHAAQLSDELAAQGTPLVWVHVPRRHHAFVDLLPELWAQHIPGEQEYVRAALHTGDPVVDLLDALTAPQSRADYFFRTDHHWTPAGALVAHDALAAQLQEMGIAVGDLPTLTEVTYPSFFGSIGRLATAGAGVAPDEFVVPTPAGGFSATICRDDDCTHPVFDNSQAREGTVYQDRYRAFTGTNRALVHIVNEHANNDTVLVVLKDSYANATMTYLSEHVAHIYMIDERHWEGGPVADFALEVKADAVVVFHKTDTYATLNRLETAVWFGAVATSDGED